MLRRVAALHLPVGGMRAGNLEIWSHIAAKLGAAPVDLTTNDDDYSIENARDGGMLRGEPAVGRQG